MEGLEGKFALLNAYIENKVLFQAKNLSAFLQNLGKDWQNKPKERRRYSNSRSRQKVKMMKQ